MSQHFRLCRRWFYGIALIAGLPAAAQPPVDRIEETIGLNAPMAVFDPQTHHLDLRLRLIRSQIYSPAKGGFDQVDLRGYVIDTAAIVDAVPQGVKNDTESPFIAPTIFANPGDTVSLTLHNDLPAEPDCDKSPHNVPHCFNTTNLHTHGLWVSPKEDDVFKTIKPGETGDYVYHIPADHTGGTLWYHPHNHGSTAIQVGGGVAGALIIRGTAKPTAKTNGDIDTLLAPLAVKERVMVFQQIQYACFDANGAIKTNSDGTWLCGPTDIGSIKDYAQLGFDPTKSAERWSVSGRFTSINGYVMPHFVDAVAGRVERWRMIDAGLANTIGIEIRGVALGAPDPSKLDSKANGEWVKKYCTGETVRQFGIASDGLTRDTIADRGPGIPTILQPGYREDVLLTFPKAGRYCVVDSQAEETQSITGLKQRPQLLGWVDVSGQATIADQTAALRGGLQSALPKVGYDKETVAAVAKDLSGKTLRLSRFVPHPSLMSKDAATLGKQEVAFNISGGKFMVGDSLTDKKADRPYDPTQWRILKLGQTDQWEITSRAGSHPFHIHVNPFQIYAILNDKGVDVSETGEPNDTQYAGLKGVWRDTLLVKSGYKLILRTEYRRFDGNFVLHCHILDHEDQGMMENVAITPTGKAPPEGMPAGHVM